MSLQCNFYVFPIVYIVKCFFSTKELDVILAARHVPLAADELKQEQEQQQTWQRDPSCQWSGSMWEAA